MPLPLDAGRDRVEALSNADARRGRTTGRLKRALTGLGSVLRRGVAKDRSQR